MRTKIFVVAVFLALFMAKSTYAQNRYFLAQVATGHYAGGSYRTTFILFNNTDADTTTSLQLTDDNGNPLTVTIPGLGTNSQFSISLTAGACRILQTDGSGNLATGSATVASAIAIGVSAIFTIYDPNGNYVTEAGVGSSNPLSEFVLPVDTTGFFNTGLALFNAGGVDASITLILRNTSGQEVLRAPLTLKSNYHIARFVAGTNQLFPSISSFQGTLLVQSSVPIAALVLRQNGTPLSYTSLPAVPTTSTKTILNLAHVANGAYGGGSYKTSFLIFNLSSTLPANVTLSLTIPVTIANQGTSTSFNFSLGPGASIFLQTDGSGTVATGAATVTSTSSVPIGASGIFTVLDSQGAFQTEAGVGDSPIMTSLTLPVDVIGNFDTGVAFFNPTSSTATLTFRLLDPSGFLVGSSATRSLSPNGHTAEFASQLFPGTSNFFGSVAVTATAGVASLTLRQNTLPLSYTTLPTASGTATGKTAIAPLLSKKETGITALINDPNVVVNETLLPGFKLSGTVSGAGQGIQVIASAGTSNVFAGQVDPLTGKYLIVVPGGTYSLTTCYQPAGALSVGVVTVTFADPNAVQVSGDTTRDITLPAVPLSNVSGAVSGLNGLPSGVITTIVFTATDNTRQGQFTLDASGNYQGVLPAGNYLVGVSRAPIQFALLQNESLQLYNIGSLTVGGGPGTGNYAIPATATLSGSILGGGLLSIPPGTIVTATDTSAPSITQPACCAAPATSSATANLLAQYQTVLAQNRSFAVSATVPIGQGLNLASLVTYPLSPSAVSLGVNTSLDIVIPNLPRSATIFGQVKDGAGVPIANVVVTAYSQSIQDAANVGFTAVGKTDAFGNYSITVLSGTNYQLTFVPPAPPG